MQDQAKKGLTMLSKTQLIETIDGLQTAVDDNVRAIISARKAGANGVHRIIAQAPALSFTLSALSQMQDLLVEMEDAEAAAEDAQEDSLETVEVENPFAKRMREAREAKASKRQRR